MKIIKTYPIFSGFIFLLTWQFMLIFQGLDIADTGFHLTAFTYIFKAPYSVQYSMSFWLSDVLGHLWMSIWPVGGLLWARIGWVVAITISIAIYFSMLKPEYGHSKSILGLLVTTIFILQGGPECINYDIFTILGYAVSITFLYNGLLKSSFHFIFMAGLALGISVFFKLTNLAALVFILVIPFWVYIQKKSISHLFKLLFLFGFGMIAGALFVWFLILKTGHKKLFLDNLAFISNMAQDSSASHGLIPLLTSYLSGYFNAFIMLAISVLAILVLLAFTKRLNLISPKKTRQIILFFTTIITAILMFVFEKPFWSKIRYLFIGLMLLEAITSIINKKMPAQRRLLNFIGLLLLLVVPLGSDSGLEKSVFGMWILGPIVLTNLRFEIFTNRFQLSKEQLNFAQKTLITIVFVVSILFAWQNTYFDTGSRLKKIFPVIHPKLKLIFTSKERAKVLNELVTEGLPKIKNHTCLLSFIEIPMINYLAEKEPFISTSWPKLYYSPESFEEKLNEALEKRKTLPAIVRQKQRTGNEDWPKEQAGAQYLNYSKNLSKYPKHEIILNRFIKKNNYTIVWENEMFQVLLSEKQIGAVS